MHARSRRSVRGLVTDRGRHHVEPSEHQAGRDRSPSDVPELNDPGIVDSEKTPSAGEHVVADGESLDDVAEKTGLSATKLQRLHATKHTGLIWPGMTLRMQ